MMRNLEMNDWLTLNNIIYKIYTMKDLNNMRETLLEHLQMLLHYDSADFYLAYPDGRQGLTRPVFYNCDTDYSELYEEMDYSRGIMYGGRSMVYRETDIMADEKRVKTAYYQKVYRPNQWHYALQMIICRRKRFLGVITFYRNVGKEDFEYSDVFLLDMLKDHLAYRLEQSFIEPEDEVKISVSEAAGQYDLTRRETLILACLMGGKNNEEMAAELVISVNTIKKHILNIYRKLGIRNRVQMFKMIREHE